MRFDKKTEAWVRRGIALEEQGLEPGIIGNAARMERLKELRRKARYYRSFILRAAKADLKIVIVEKPEMAGDHMTIRMMLELPLEGDGVKLTGKAESALQAFVKAAVGSTKKSGRRTGRRAKLA